MTNMQKSKCIALCALIGTVFMLLTGYAFSADETDKNVFTEDKLNFTIQKANPNFTIRLKSNPTTGFAWFLRDYDSAMIEPISHSFRAANTKLIGAPGYENWVFRVKPAAFVVPQQTALRFVYARPWQGNEDAKQATFNVSTMK